MPIARRAFRVALFLLLIALAAPAPAQVEPGWMGNMARNPGFEEDFVNLHGEGHVLSFKGDWFYNQKDLIPDYWDFKGNYTWTADRPHGGAHALKLDAAATATQSYFGAQYHEGGGSWGGAAAFAIPIADPAKFNQPLRATVWVRGEGSLTLAAGVGAGVTVKGTGAAWQKITADMPIDKIDAGKPVTVTLTGPGEFDDLDMSEKASPAPNLIPNPGFEEADASGAPKGWSAVKKYRALGPTYYVWTDWNHAFRAPRGPVVVDKLVALSGKQSLRFDVYPGDEKYVESDVIPLNQTAAGVIEVGVWVRADRIKLIDIRCVDLDGANCPSVYPMQPENTVGSQSAAYGNGTFEWRYIRKFFAMPPTYDAAGKPAVDAEKKMVPRSVKGIRVRLAARGFNAHTLDDAGTRSYACQVGTLWWDNLHVSERGTDAAALGARGVKTYPAADAAAPALSATVDLGERLYGQNKLRVSVKSPGNYKVKLTTTLPGSAPAVTESGAVTVAANTPGTLEVPYEITKLAGDLSSQGTLKVELSRDGKPVAAETYAFNTWPVVVDFDVARHYNLPAENPVTTSLNLGVAADTLAKVAKLELSLVKVGDGKTVVQALPAITDLKKAFADTLAILPKTAAESYEFNLPTPAWWTDRTNFLLMKLDLSALKIWPHDNPTRDTVLRARGLDAAGKVLFEGVSDPFCRMQAPPAQPPIASVAVREDGAILINGQPRYLMGASHQDIRVAHTPAIQQQLGLMGLRLEDSMKFDQMLELYTKYGLYLLQAKPVTGMGSTTPVPDMTDAQKAELTAFVAAGGMKNIVSFNTGGWEAVLEPRDPATLAKHAASNDWIYNTTKRPVAISFSGAFNAWNLSEQAPFYDHNHCETAMWGPMDLNVTYIPYAKAARKRPTAWVYLPQLYDNTPYERYRFETYENIVRGSAGVEMIQGIGDSTFNRGLAGELRGLEAPLNSLDKPPAVTFEPNISHKVTSYKGKTYILATNAGPIQIGTWKWTTETKKSGTSSHEGDTHNTMWFRPAGIRIHGFRGLPHPELIQKGDTIVQWVWVDPKETPDWAMVCVRGDGKFTHNAVVGKFEYAKFAADYGYVIMYSELEHSVWHEINWIFDQPTYDMAVKLMGKAWADTMKASADQYKIAVDAKFAPAGTFTIVSPNIDAMKGGWVKIEMDAEKYGLVGKLVDGFAFLTQNGRALWDDTTLVRDGKVVRVFCDDSVGIDRSLLAKVKISVPGLKKGTKIKPMFEDREIVAEDGYFTDNFEGTDTYGYEAGGVEGDMMGYVKDPNRELPRMMPSGYGYSYGPTQVRIYEVGP
jgi:hypothetical protein